MMELRGQQQEKRLGMPNSLAGFNPSISDPPTKISSINTTAGNGISVLTSPRHASTVDHHHPHHHHLQQQQHGHYHHHHHQRQQHHPQQQQQQQQHNRQDERSPEPPPPPPPPPQAQARPDPDPERDPDPVSIAVVSAAIQPISTAGTNPRTPRSKIPSAANSAAVRYRECLKNHAANIGGHVVDGCGEFMPGGEDGSPDALKCAACDCHRNFHRKEIEGDHHHHHHHHQHGVGGGGPGGNCFYCYNPNTTKCIADSSRRNARIAAHSVQPIQHQPQQTKFSLGLPSSPPVMMAFGGGGATESSSEELNAYHSNVGGSGAGMTPIGGASSQFSLSKKRFRTKFSQEQKDRMLEFAEKVGWRIQKQDEIAVQQFCAEVGVKRQVLKVWMHNNKHAMKKKDM